MAQEDAMVLGAVQTHNKKTAPALWGCQTNGESASTWEVCVHVTHWYCLHGCAAFPEKACMQKKEEGRLRHPL